MIRNALALIILALTGQPAGQPAVPVEPSALVEAQPLVSVESALGAWRGRIVGAAGSPQALEASFFTGLRPGTVFGYFRLDEPGKPELIVRRLGRLVDGQMLFDLKERGHIALRLIEGRLVGELDDPSGQLRHVAAGAVELDRLRH